VLEFWEDQAKQHGPSDLATNPDQHYRKLEIESILRVIGTLKNKDTILDVGCGNGFTTQKIYDAYPCEIDGVDFSAQMIREACKHNPHGNVAFYEGDVLSLSRNDKLYNKGQYDVVVSTRCLINLANWSEQQIGILEMKKVLKPGGRLILVENFKEGLANLNHIRARFGLDPINERWHNNYIPDADFQKFMASMQGQLTQEYVENIGNMYYMASRVIYAKMCKDQGIEPDYNNPINEIASQMPTFGEFYACSPNMMLVLKNEATAGKSLS